MSTNYYFKIKNSDEIKKEVKELLKEKKLDFVLGGKILNDEGWIFNDTIHIGKSYGDNSWRPLFQKTEQFSSLKGLIEFYENNKDKLIIESECYGEITFEELKKNMFFKKGKFHMTDELFKIYEDDKGYQFGIDEFS